VPGKNLKELGGKPLIAWTIETAQDCDVLDRTIVSTDDEQIARVAREFGAEIPFMRPGDLALDETPDLPVCLHVLEELERTERFIPEVVVWLRPTSPLRLGVDVQSALDVLDRTDADCVRSMCEAHHHPYWMKRLEGERLVSFDSSNDEHKYPRRQDLPPLYRFSSAVDLVRRTHVPASGMLFQGDMAAYVMPADRCIDIDTETDFVLAEAMLRARAHG
jgi:CMP-N-acetylneuraminic acid synthetase